ncbi:GNAT family N-acetyltransferase [Roseitalea porphyridii]|uniref:GNAT family N-acetyltransferase n=1 Tax=Roseitalea porphyridii TaxID=1852022 RepID=A0A4P6V377_9HYPH|nr:GNAT family N-acetyltransferase [Roseitalea porphyridii]QBK31353.1 GNAT family N-acetyltransferase [Roseitalea porphyridii]
MLGEIVFVAGEEPALVEETLAPMSEAAEAAGRPFEIEPFHLRAVGNDGRFLGGAFCRIMQGWVYVAYIGVSADARGGGIGAALMARIETVARERGLAGVYLDTFDFQAPGFYDRMGYAEIGRLPAVGDAPQRIWYCKRLDAAGNDGENGDGRT